jgi:hypothetical protein
VAGTRLDAHEGGEHQCRGPEEHQGRRRSPAVVGTPVQGVHEQQQPTGHRGRAGHVEPARAPLGAVVDEEHGGKRDEDDADGNVDEEHPPPAGPVGQQPTRDDADCRRRPAHRAVDAEGAVALLALGEGDSEDRQCRRRHQGGAEALEAAGCDQEPDRLGDARKERGAGEDGQPGQENPASPEQVGQPPPEQKEPSEHEAVGDDDPLQGALADAEVTLDRRERHIHDGDVEDDHELRGARQRQDHVLGAGTGGGGHVASLIPVFAIRRTGDRRIDTLIAEKQSSCF